MNVTAIKSPRFHPPKDQLGKLLQTIPTLSERDVVAVSSKVISICEGRCVSAKKISKQFLVKRESDKITIHPTRAVQNWC